MPESRPGKVHAQISSPSYTCDIESGTNVSPCAEYIVLVSTRRGASGYFVYQVPDTPVDPFVQWNINPIATGDLAGGVSMQAFMPNSSAQTFTLNLSEP